MADYVKELRALIGTQPIILVGSTVVVLNKQNEVLLQLRSDTKEWGLPGGAMELGETLEQTAKRELHEETGLTANSLKLFGVLSGKELYFKYPHSDEVYNVITVYLAEHVRGSLSMNDEESIELKYFPLLELPSKLDDRARLILNKFFTK